MSANLSDLSAALTTLWQGQASTLAQWPLPLALAGLFVLALLAATLLPLGSEVALLALASTHSGALVWLWLAATAGNTLGSLITYGMGRGAHRLLRPAGASPPKKGMPAHAPSAATRDVAAPASTSRHAAGAAHTPSPHTPSPHGRAHALAHRWVQRHGAWVCLLAWLPVVGDPLCAAAGWFRLPFWPCALCMALGKGGRYAALLWLAI